MINYHEARSIAEAEIKQMKVSAYSPKMMLIEAYTETPFLWVFYYQSEEFVKTGNMGSMVGGNSPFLIDKTDGRVLQYATGYDVEQMIELFEEENNIRQLVLIGGNYDDPKKLNFLRKILGWTMQELGERKKQNIALINSGNQSKLLPIQRSLQAKGIQTEILVSERYRGLAE